LNIKLAHCHYLRLIVYHFLWQTEREKERKRLPFILRGHSVILIISNTDGDDHHDQLITSRGKKTRRRNIEKKKGSFAHIHFDKRTRGHALFRRDHWSNNRLTYTHIGDTCVWTKVFV
jgi:hypothetical protein